MAILVIGEKPSVSKELAKVLGADQDKKTRIEGNGYIVSWCFGHLVGLKYPNDYGGGWEEKWSFSQLPMIPEKWLFQVADSTKAQFNVLKGLMNSSEVTEIICATDADREGECIFRYVYQMAKCRKPVKRLWVSSLEERAIRSALDKMKPMNYYEQDLKKLKSILMKTDSLALNSDMYAKTISGYFTMALSKLKKKNKADADFMGLLLFFAGNSQIISDKYEIVYNAYYDAVRFLITEPEFWISDYCNIVLKTIKAFSAKLEADEFYSIYMDMVNHTAADYLGPDLVDIINTYTRYAYVTDKETEFEKYLAISLE